MAIQLKDGYTPNIDATIDSNGWNIKVTYVVTNDDFSDGMEYRILTSSIVPKRGDAYPSDALISADTVKATPINNGDDGDYINWYVEVNYKTPSDTDQEDANPLDQKASISIRSNQYTKAADKAYAPTDEVDSPSIPVQTNTQELISLTKIISNANVTIQQNTSSWNPNWTLDFENTLNDSKQSIAGISVGPKQARMLVCTASNAFDNDGNEYFVSTMEIEISKEGFNEKPLNQGFYKQDPDTADPIARVLILKKDISNETGDKGEEQIEEAWKIDENREPITGEGASYLDFQIMPSVSWKSLPIPRNFG